MAKKLKLTGRLGKIAGFIKEGSAVADIGSDHGFIPIYLAQNGPARRIIASDISAGSLKAAINNAVKYGVDDQISFIVAPGLDGIGEYEADTIVIAGMGGETISAILAGAPWTKQHGVRLILQPQTKLNKLCIWLQDNGYIITDADYVVDKGRFYIIIVVVGVPDDPMKDVCSI